MRTCLFLLLSLVMVRRGMRGADAGTTRGKPDPDRHRLSLPGGAAAAWRRWPPIPATCPRTRAAVQRVFDHAGYGGGQHRHQLGVGAADCLQVGSVGLHGNARAAGPMDRRSGNRPQPIEGPSCRVRLGLAGAGSFHASKHLDPRRSRGSLLVHGFDRSRRRDARARISALPGGWHSCRGTGFAWGGRAMYPAAPVTASNAVRRPCG